MKLTVKLGLVLLIALARPVILRAADAFVWHVAPPESQGMSTAKLDSLRDDLAGRRTTNFLVVRNDKIVYEWYAPDKSAGDKAGTASLAKAIVGGMSLAVALTDGRIGLDDPVAKYVPQWKSDPRKSKITVRHLGSHTSGFDDSRPNEEAQWKDDFWQRLDPPKDPFTIARDLTPVLFEPGANLQYSNPGIAMLTYAVTAAIKDTPVHDIRTLLRERIMRPIGADDRDWSCGYGKTFVVDGLPLVGSWGGGAYTQRAAARVGRLVLRQGDWDGKRLLSKEAVRQVTTDAGLPGNCGMGWWTNAQGHYADVPADAVWGRGKGDQLLLVVPSRNLILVRNGGELEPEQSLAGAKPSGVRDARIRQLFKQVVEACDDADLGQSVARVSRGAAPYPASRVIARIDWAPRDSIVRLAPGSDNWPLTWADDDALYGLYGDGNGFVPFVEKKLSIGLARIVGGPTDFRGINLRSSDIEEQGDGAHGRKASGILMVDGVLYAWLRNAGNSILAWSRDHGKTWQQADWKWTTSFGSPTFLNFGRNYAEARDDFVYVYSSDGDSAYVPSDRMVLARVPRERLRERPAYEFFTGQSASGQPQWSHDISRRGAVFSHPHRCYRTGITYNAALKRYLWCQILPESTHTGGPRFQGGFGVYDAPEPWGPWTTAYFTNEWDVGPGDTSSFPTKWMSSDGCTLYLVFSGDDHFSVRQARLTLVEPGS